MWSKLVVLTWQNETIYSSTNTLLISISTSMYHLSQSLSDIKKNACVGKYVLWVYENIPKIKCIINY